MYLPCSVWLLKTITSWFFGRYAIVFSVAFSKAQFGTPPVGFVFDIYQDAQPLVGGIMPLMALNVLQVRYKGSVQRVEPCSWFLGTRSCASGTLCTSSASKEKSGKDKAIADALLVHL